MHKWNFTFNRIFQQEKVHYNHLFHSSLAGVSRLKQSRDPLELRTAHEKTAHGQYQSSPDSQTLAMHIVPMHSTIHFFFLMNPSSWSESDLFISLDVGNKWRIRRGYTVLSAKLTSGQTTILLWNHHISLSARNGRASDQHKNWRLLCPGQYITTRTFKGNYKVIEFVLSQENNWVCLESKKSQSLSWVKKVTEFVLCVSSAENL